MVFTGMCSIPTRIGREGFMSRLSLERRRRVKETARKSTADYTDCTDGETHPQSVSSVKSVVPFSVLTPCAVDGRGGTRPSRHRFSGGRARFHPRRDIKRILVPWRRQRL